MIEIQSEELYRSEPRVNMTDDMVRVTLLCDRNEWRRFKRVHLQSGQAEFRERMTTCRVCRGSGRMPLGCGFPPGPCRACGGAGEWTDAQALAHVEPLVRVIYGPRFNPRPMGEAGATCPTCGGTGELTDGGGLLAEDCPDCDGTGEDKPR